MEVEGGSVSVGLSVPSEATHVIVVVQGGGSRLLRRSRAAALAADALGAGVVTVPVFTPEEAAVERSTGAIRFDIGRLARRLTDVLDALPEVLGRHRRLSLHATGTGAAAALVAAAQRPGRIGAIVSAAGRPDLARPVLHQVHAPTLLVVGGRDLVGVRASCDALRYLPRVAHLALVPGGSATLEADREQLEVAQLIATWVSQCEACS